MEEILDDLLSFSRPDALKPEWVSIDKLLEKTIIASQRSIEHHHVRLISSYQPGLPMLNADPRKLRQAFTNLIVNAAHATDGVQTGEIGVTARLEIGSEQPFVRIEVADNGRGIDPTQCEKLFEPFFTTKAKGTGLGLAIVRRIIEQHLGTVHLESNENSGSRAVVLLPIGLAAGADLEAKRSSLDDASPSRLKASAT
jgi:signal transduction histidine kinase